MPAAPYTPGRLANLADVGVSAPSNGQVLTYQTSSGKWINSTPAGGTVTSVSGSGGATGLTLTGGPITSSGTLTLGGSLATGAIAAGAVTYAKIQNVGASSLLGNPGGSAAVPSEITLGTGLSFAGSVLNAAGGSPGGSSGQFQYNNSGAFGGATFSAVATSGNLLTLTAQAATDVPFTIKGAASQSANLQEWRDNARNLTGVFTAVGSNNSSSFAVFRNNGTQYGSSLNASSNDQTLVLFNATDAITVGSGGGLSAGYIVSDRGGYPAGFFFSSNNIGQGGIPNGQVITPYNGDNNTYLGTSAYRWAGMAASYGQFLGASPSQTPLTVAGAASQSAPLLQLQGVDSLPSVQPMADIDTAWHVNTDATRSADLILRAWDYTGASEVFRGRAIAGTPYLGFFGATPVAQPVLATGAGHTTDDVIAVLQAFGIARQS